MTSANTHGAPAPDSFAAAEERIVAGVDVAVDAGRTTCRDASTIVAVRDGEPVILREGAISAGEIGRRSRRPRVQQQYGDMVLKRER